jgi:hypothetical protein
MTGTPCSLLVHRRNREGISVCHGRAPSGEEKGEGVGRLNGRWDAIFKGVLAAAIGGHGRLLQSTSLHRDRMEHALDGRFWHFLFGFGPRSLQKICSLMYNL